MKIEYFNGSLAMSRKATQCVLEEVRRKPHALLCAATGNSPKELYQNLALEKTLFHNVRIIPLDEWIGLTSAEGSCHSYIEEYILNPLQISEDHYFGFNVDANPLEKECERIHALLKDNGPIDMCILGLGKNGHLGFNEPAIDLRPHCHIADLTAQSQEHSMIGHTTAKPTMGLTLGMHDILAAKKILLLVSGSGKEEAIKQLLSRTITNACPASWLWKHDNVDCLILK